MTTPDPAAENLRAMLTALFEETLQQAPIGADADFFDLGGDSVLAVAMALQIQDIAGVTLPSTALFDAPTVATLTQAVQAARRAPRSPLVLLKPGSASDGMPVFLEPGLTGTAVELAALARRLDTPGPVFGLETPGLAGECTPADSIEALATSHLAAIRQAGLPGPYALGGYSMGGFVVLEMARQLRAQGGPEPLLALLDTRLLRFEHLRLPDRARLLADRIGWHAATMRRLPAVQLPGYLARRLRPRGRPSAAALVPALAPMRVPMLPGPALRVLESRRLATRSYLPKRYDGAAYLMVAADHPGGTGPLGITWAPLLPRLTVLRVPGDHWGMMSAAVGSTAAGLSALLRRGERDRVGKSYTREITAASTSG